MVARAVARGVGLFVLLGASVALLHAIGQGFNPVTLWVSPPVGGVAIAFLALAVLGLLGFLVFRLLTRSGAEILVTGTVVAAGLVAATTFLALYETDNPLVNRLVPFSGIDYQAVPRSADFPADLTAAGAGRFRLEVSNETGKTTAVWCFVEAPLKDDDAIQFKDFKVEGVPAGDSKVITGVLEGTGSGPFSGGCRLTSY
jgi:hypothetical protein